MRAAVPTLALLGALFAGAAHAGSPGPDPHRFACQGDRTQALIGYYLEQAVKATGGVNPQIGLSRFGYQDGHCFARVDVNTDADSGMTWAQYSVTEQPGFAIKLWFAGPLAPIADTPTQAHPRLLDAVLEKQMRASGYADRFRDNGPQPPIARLEALGEARRKLLAAGWKPVKAPADDEGDFGAEGFRKAGYVETEDCAMDTSICMLRYAKGRDGCLSVLVDGEEPADAFVDSWDFTCPKP